MNNTFDIDKIIVPFDFIDVNDKNFSIGNKALNLCFLKQNNIPIPDGYCITEDLYKYYLKNNEIPSTFIKKLIEIKKELGDKIAIRSSANYEDGDTTSMAGIFESYFVYDDEEIENAIINIFNQSRSEKVLDYLNLCNINFNDLQVSLIIQQLIESDYTGVIYTGVNKNDLLVQYYDNCDSNLLDDSTNVGSILLINKEGYIEKSNGFDLRKVSNYVVNDIHYYSNRILKLFNDIDQDIEFACKDDKVYILQSRTLTTKLNKISIDETLQQCLESVKIKLHKIAEKEKKQLKTKTAIFSNANYSELLPKPTEMDIGIYTYIFTGCDEIPGGTQKARNEMGYLNGKESIGIIFPVAGRTYFSISKNASLYYIGFPYKKEDYFSILVNEYLQTIENNPSKGLYPQMGLYLQNPTLEDLELRFGNNARNYMVINSNFSKNLDNLASNFYLDFINNIKNKINSFVEDKKKENILQYSNEELVNYCINILEHLRLVTCLNFAKTARLGFYYSQKIMEILQNRFQKSELESKEIFSKLTQGLDGSDITEINIAITNAVTYKEAMNIANTRIGHFSSGEMLEIHHKRLKDDINLLNNYVKGIREFGDYITKHNNQKKERLLIENKLLNKITSNKEKLYLKNIFENAQKYMALRETIKYMISIEYSLIKDSLLLLEKKLNLNEGDIYYLYPRELSSFIKCPKSMIHLINSRKISFSNYDSINLPNIIRESDIDKITLYKKNNKDFIEETGSFLAHGEKFKGIIVNLEDFSRLEDAYSVVTKYINNNIKVILVAKQMNLSHDPLIYLSSGLVIQNAGIVSHGAQRARELGKGAISGIQINTLKTGTKAYFDPDKMTIKKVN